MFAVIYTFKVKPGEESELIEGWKGLTKLIYQYEGSLGSKLHRNQDGDFVAYAQWPTKEVWENAGSNLPKEESDKFRAQMKNSSFKIETKYELEMVEDLTMDKVFNPTI